MNKVTGYLALVTGLAGVIFLTVNFFSFDVRRGSFIQSHLGIYEPVGTLTFFVISLLLIAIALHLIWTITYKKIIPICIVAVIGLCLLPVIFIFLHAGEL